MPLRLYPYGYTPTGNPTLFKGDLSRLERNPNRFQRDSNRFKGDSNRFEHHPNRFEHYPNRFQLNLNRSLSMLNPLGIDYIYDYRVSTSTQRHQSSEPAKQQ